MNSADSSPAVPHLRETLGEVQAAARDQLAAAWQLHVDSVQAQLEAGWREHIARVFEERFSELSEMLEKQVENAIAERSSREWQVSLREARVQSTRRQADELTQALAALKLTRDTAAWGQTVAQASGLPEGAAALFLIENDRLQLAGPGQTEEASEFPEQGLPLGEAPAIAHACADLAVAELSRSSEDLPEIIAARLQGPGESVLLAPVVLKGKSVAVLCGVTGDPEASRPQLELAAVLAGLMWEARGGPALHAAIWKTPARSVEWSSLSREDQDFHLRAQRYARVQVAELRLYKSEVVKAGRAAADLYGALRPEIEACREAFRREFIEPCSSMTDYYHWELLRTLANDNPALLGPGYPGPLV